MANPKIEAAGPRPGNTDHLVQIRPGMADDSVENVEMGSPDAEVARQESNHQPQGAFSTPNNEKQANVDHVNIAVKSDTPQKKEEDKDREKFFNEDDNCFVRFCKVLVVIICCPCGLIWLCCSSLWKNCGKICDACCNCIGKCFSGCCDCIAKCLAGCCDCIGKSLAKCCNSCCECLEKLCNACSECISNCSCEACGKCIDTCCSGICECFSGCCEGVANCFKSICKGIEECCSAIYQRCLRPICVGIRECFRAIGRAIKESARSIKRAFFKS